MEHHNRVEQPVIATDHVVTRAQQRGVRRGTIDLIARFGKRSRAKGGLYLRQIGKLEATLLRERRLADPSDLERTKGVRIITSEDESDSLVVVTVYPRDSSGSYRMVS